MPGRIDRIRKLLEDEPQDTFLRYSLAMELQKEGSADESLRLLDELMSGEPPYVPAFFMAGQQLARQGRIEEAQDRLTRGIAAARQQGDLHAAEEMTGFLTGLGEAD